MKEAQGKLSSMGVESFSRRVRTYIPSCLLYTTPRVVLRWLKNWKSAPVLDWLKAAHYYRLGDFRTALECYQVGLKRHSEHPAASSARLDAAFCMIKIGRLDKAREALYSLMKDEPDCQEAVVLLLRVLRYLADRRASLDVAEAVLNDSENNALTIAAAAHALIWAADDAEDAVELRSRIFIARSKVELGSREDYALQTAFAHFELRFLPDGNFDRTLARVLASGNAPYEAIVLKASQFLDQGRFIQARHQFQRALRIRTEDPQPWIGVARSYLSSCDEDELEYAHQAAERACNLSNYRDCNALRVLIHSCKSLRRDSDVELYQTHLHELELEEGLNPESIKDLERQIELLQYIG